MKIEDFIAKANQAVVINEVSPNLWQLESEATFLNGNEILVYLKNENGKWFFTDEKETLKYMHEFYELKSNDVKMCITNVLKIYGFKINGGKLIAEIVNLSSFMDKYFDFIMCIGQLANMFAFFDKPENA